MASTDKVIIYAVVGVLLVVLIGIFVVTNKSNSKDNYALGVAAAAMAASGSPQGNARAAMTLNSDGEIVLNNMYAHTPSSPASPMGGGEQAPEGPSSPIGMQVGGQLVSQRSEVFGQLAASILKCETTSRKGTGTASVVTM